MGHLITIIIVVIVNETYPTFDYNPRSQSERETNTEQTFTH